VEAVTARLLPLATVVTPNVHEAERLAGFGVRTVDDAERAGHAIRDRGAAAVLVKGGHLAGAPGTDVLVTAVGVQHFEGDWVETKHTHGTGCTYSAAIATHLALGRPLPDAIARAKEYLVAALRAGFPVGQGVSPPDPFHRMRGGTA
jgi:hydroxymethylpyrimidine/phosphomethylpyrimidine kinase